MKIKPLLLIGIVSLICTCCSEKAEYSINEIKKLEESAADNNQEAQRKLLEYYEKKAHEGDADAQYKLGEIYYTGKGVNKDLNKATQFYQQAADQGHSDAQNRLNENSQLEPDNPAN